MSTEIPTEIKQTLAKLSLSPRDRVIVECFMGEALGDLERAAGICGLSSKTVKMVLAKPQVAEAISLRTQLDPRVLTRMEIQSFLSDVVRGAVKDIVKYQGEEYAVTPSLKIRITAAELLCRTRGDLKGEGAVGGGSGAHVHLHFGPGRGAPPAVIEAEVIEP